MDNIFEGISILSHPMGAYYGEFKYGKSHGISAIIFKEESGKK